MNIAILDDETIICEGLSAMLSARKEVEWNLAAIYHDAEEALETCNWDKIDLLIADINMPGLTGLELTSVLRERGYETLVIIISGYAQFEYAQKAMQNDVVDFVIKPISSDKLFYAIEKAQKKLAVRMSEKNSRLFIQNNLDRLMREYFSELLFDTEMMSPDQKDSLAASFGLQSKKFVIVLLYASARGRVDSGKPDKCVELGNGSGFLYPNGSGIYIMLAVFDKAVRVDASYILSVAEKKIGRILWHGISCADRLETIKLSYARLLEEMRDSGVLCSIQLHQPKIGASELLSPKGDYAPSILGAIEIIKRDYSKPLSLTKLSEQLFVHPTYLSNVFKRQTGMALIDYLNHYRVERAKELLIDPLNKIFWITEQVGFVNQRYFSQVFKRITGLTPVEYRTNCYLNNSSMRDRNV